MNEDQIIKDLKELGKVEVFKFNHTNRNVVIRIGEGFRGNFTSLKILNALQAKHFSDFPFIKKIVMDDDILDLVLTKDPKVPETIQE